MAGAEIVLGFYLPMGEPRLIPEGVLIHRSVLERMDKDPAYRPTNLPKDYRIEELTPAPAPPAEVAAPAA
ncbi:hypothetical protein [Bradyrhizobium semiaridum]|uniref:hypothetical protein n=1 Tax=Bradyrhizobium semiaridum TaxID=2821404 RepID=UPI0028986212|nr:hypothetical protein [Bradyrhizobium semiaridum]